MLASIVVLSLTVAVLTWSLWSRSLAKWSSALVGGALVDGTGIYNVLLAAATNALEKFGAEEKLIEKVVAVMDICGL